MERIASNPTLDVRDLSLVLALASAGSTVRAATTLHVTQSAVSRGLLLAEEKVGTRLFERTARGLVPTPAGARLLDGAAPLLAQLAALEASVKGVATPPLRIVCECYNAYRWLPSAVTRLKLDVVLAIDYTRTPVPALADDRIDVALLSTSVLPPALRRRFEERPLFDDEIVFVVSEKHPLAEKKTLDEADLRAYPLISSTLTPDPERKAFMLRAFGKNPRPLSIRAIQLPLTEAMVDAARAGMGIAVMSEWITAPYLEGNSGLVAKRLRSRAILRPWRIAYRKDRSEAALRLAAAIEHEPPRVYVKGGKRTAGAAPTAAGAARPG